MKRLSGYLLIAILLFLFCSAETCLFGGSGKSKSDSDDDADEYESLDASTDLIWQNGPKVGAQTLPWSKVAEYCDKLEWAGSDNWRVPNISELRTLIRGCPGTESDGECGITDQCASEGCSNYQCNGCEKNLGPASEGAYWHQVIKGKTGFYWSSTKIYQDDLHVPAVDFAKGAVYRVNKSSSYRVRCVRNPDDPSGVWTDPATGLHWTAEPMYQAITWQAALQHCTELELGPASAKWRLPTINELRTLVRKCDSTYIGGTCPVSDDCIQKECFDSQYEACMGCDPFNGPTSHGCYSPPELTEPSCAIMWSSTELTSSDPFYANYMWTLDLGSAWIWYMDKNVPAVDVRCVY